MTHAPGSKVGGYEIVSLLGTGGMGEVYAARDARLGRMVALKTLPREASTDPERRARFEREARAIAALNHPNIVTIHSVEEADGDVFLTMELVEGKSLADVLPDTGYPLNQLLAIVLPVVNAVVAAHQKGITHRDLKPANIMLGEGDQAGRVKVLDFGLAKLTDSTSGSPSGTSTTAATDSGTGEGRILGTVHYMSPEQAQGLPVDARTDVFALGVILYEMATGRRPFTGETSMSVLSSIIKDTPPVITEINPALPGAFARIVRRALAKDPERRYQTAKDLRNDLDELRASLESGEAESPTASSLRSTDSPPRPATARLAPVAAALTLLLLAGGGLWYARHASQSATPTNTSSPAETTPLRFEITPVTSGGRADRPALSPDGRYIAYVRETVEDGRPIDSIWLRQVATTGDVQIVPPSPDLYPTGMTITPDGNYLDYVVGGGIGRRELWRIPLLGGGARKILDGVDSPIGWSPDGRRIAFLRTARTQQQDELWTANADGSSPTLLSSRQSGAYPSLSSIFRPNLAPAWSPNGRTIAVAAGRNDAVPVGEVEFVDTATGTARAVAAHTSSIVGLDWLSDDTVVISESAEVAAPRQLWTVSSSRGTVTRVTNDLSNYNGVRINTTRDALATTLVARTGTLWAGDSRGQTGAELLTAVPLSLPPDYNFLTWAGDRVVLTTSAKGFSTVSTIGSTGGPTNELVSRARTPQSSADGSVLVFQSTDPAKPGTWRSTNGGGPELLETKQPFWLSASLDAANVAFISGATGRQSLWALTPGLPARQLTSVFASRAVISPDGRTVSFITRDELSRNIQVVCPVADCREFRRVPVPATALDIVRWAPDGKSLTYLTGSPLNIWSQPLDGTAPHQLTHFSDPRAIADFCWSADGKRLAVMRSTTTSDVVLFKGLR